MKKRTWVLFSIGFTFVLGASAQAEVGVSPTEIVLGASRNLSNMSDSRPAEIAAGQKLYFDELNHSGGVFGRKLVLKEYDDAYDTKKTFENVKTLLETDKVFMIFGTYGTANLKSASRIIAQDKAPAFAVSASLGWIPADEVKSIYSVKATYKDESVAMVDFAAKTKGWKRIALFHQNDALGEEGRSGLTRAAHDAGLSETLLKAYSRDGSNIDAGFIKDLRAAQADALVIFGNAPGEIKLSNELAKSDVKIPILAASPLMASNFIETAAKNRQEIYFFQGYPLSTETSVPVVAAFRKAAAKAGVKQGESELLGYIDALVTAEALKLAGPDLTRSRFLETVNTKMGDLDLKGLRISFNPDRHSGLSKIHISTLKDGALRPM